MNNQRVIKFRAWDQINKCYYRKRFFILYNGLIFTLNDNYLHADSFNINPVIGLEIEQFTGLFDKNGKEIYEGDIVKTWNRGFDANCQVRWGQAIAGFFLYNTKNGTGWDFSGGGDNYNQETCEVIGNIHENPELLNQS